jgi:hypothetical protein
MATANPLNVRTSPKFTLGEMIAAGVVKTVSERALARTPVGNGTLRSGFIKLGLAYGLYQLGRGQSGVVGSVVGVTSTAWTIDAVEDVVNAGFKMFKNANGNIATAAVPAAI